MHTHSSAAVLAASTGPALLLIIVGIVIVLGLITMFSLGRRRAARRKLPTTPTPGNPTGSLSDEAQHGTGWQTPDDDPDQGHPHR
ncbi:hypothetical protein G3I40_05295 [Streptomyces sp. SID14478]|uniref:DUF6479 family protein n=1 Tax=Streptomyces sp. SID14478 TaxID=2706073 RepID=UPI0013DCDF3B|nr:DUF6479 family protein [Streptomyces sp. SID14478]NEB74649.1 hypothetical protein [Streptomyces sp. SID14478]